MPAGLVSVDLCAPSPPSPISPPPGSRARDPGQVLGEPAVIETGDAEKALAAAAHRVDRDLYARRS